MKNLINRGTKPVSGNYLKMKKGLFNIFEKFKIRSIKPKGDPYLKRQKQLFEVFENLKNLNLIESFDKRPTIKDTGAHSFSVKLKNSVDLLLVYFFKSSHTRELQLIQDRSHEVRIVIGSKVAPKEIISLLCDVFEPKILGFKNENVLLKSFITAKKLFFKKNIFLIETSSQEDKEGIDFWIQFMRKKVPLQVKSSKRGQDEHKELYPNIPSVVFQGSLFRQTKSEYKELLEKITKIARRHVKSGVVLHL